MDTSPARIVVELDERIDSSQQTQEREPFTLSELLATAAISQPRFRQSNLT
jgi:hypothetical protein